MKIRVGFGLGTGSTVGADAFFEIVDTLERLAFDSLWVSERVTGDIPDPIVALAAVAARTTKLKFGTSVLVLPGRNPVLLAKELATIDVLSRGRLVPAFGLGADVPAEHEAFGVARGERAGRTDEATALIKQLWTQDDVTFEGRYFSVHGLTVRPRPVQHPHPDVWFGGHSEPALRRVGRIGDGWLPSFVAPGEYKAKADVIRRVADAHGREVEEEHYGALVPYAAGEDAAQRIVPLLKARRPDLDPRDVLAFGDDGLRAHLEAFVAQGASKFVVLPIVPPPSWPDELARLRESVVRPLEN